MPHTINPYETDPAKIPESDLYADVPQFGRYLPRPDDFVPDPQHINSTTPESIDYWLSVLSRCMAEFRIYENEPGRRDVFAFGSVIVKSAHLKEEPLHDYTLVDENEAVVLSLAKQALGDIRVPRIYFSGKLNGRNVLVQERIPGIAMDVAWHYLGADEKASFKDQTREVIRKLYTVTPPDTVKGPAYVIPDPDPVAHRGLMNEEWEMILSKHANDQDPRFTHNDITRDNIIVNDGKIVAVIDWEMAGFFSWDTAREVHLEFRCLKRESYANANVPEEILDDILAWNDLYSNTP
ncbi:hypothetical protein G7Z17_g671 [Cylindrodendrum hubeiense]|uniref:Aminoglycoside phosphotransferase domain-containing protein n=1 Tax=Cylindrodendrum hubeiense TaxID=595255 RepID=A0A9P5LMX0_9HYPO|nr:hypothetical protein G7Z17_g671 [Cylindrodendrum hubeiense]